jgi:hypothetical protein
MKGLKAVYSTDGKPELNPAECKFTFCMKKMR